MTVAQDTPPAPPLVGGYVLYVDHQGHPAPLSECFHATASRRLSSTVDRQHRPSTVTLVDSAYCPQCLSFHDASSAAQLGYCPKPTCVQCPLCTSVVTCRKIVDEHNNNQPVFVYACGRCSWNSSQCNLSVAASGAGDEVTKDQVITAVAELAELLKTRREGSAGKTAEDYYKQMIGAWENVVKPMPRSSSATGIGNILFRPQKKVEEEYWSVESLETATKKKQDTLSAAASENILTAIPLQHISLEEEEPTLDPALQDQPVNSFFLQGLHNHMGVKSMADLLPLAVPLRSRKSRRCRAELAEGKPGILLKPKLNPLEGDSSLRTGHGQWWKKDSSAVHVMPRVRLMRHGSISPADNSAQQHAFLLQVTNPTLGMTRLQMGVSAYEGESFWEEGQTTKNPYMENLLVDSLSNQHIDVLLLKPTNSTDNSLLKSELVELESAEDTIVDIGKVREIPEAVTNWNAETAIQAAASSDAAKELKANQVAFSGLKLIDKKSGSAWFELICAVVTNKAAHSFPAIPISLQIQVGNGSWESSLIKASGAAGEESKEVDTVSFDLVLTWPESSD